MGPAGLSGAVSMALLWHIRHHSALIQPGPPTAHDQAKRFKTVHPKVAPRLASRGKACACLAGSGSQPRVGAPMDRLVAPRVRGWRAHIRSSPSHF